MEICEIEDSIYEGMERTSIKLLNESITRICNETTKYGKLLAVVDMQISLELLMKCYILKTYGFDEILTLKLRNLRLNNPIQYKELLLKNDIKTLGFNDIKKLLEQKSDVFAPIINKGCCPCFGLDYSYLEGEFDKFQSIRNRFVHIGTELSEEESKWIETDYFALVTMFISLLLREIDQLKNNPQYRPKVYGDYDNLWDTPVDIFRNHFTKSTLDALLNNKCFYSNLRDFASDAYEVESYTCTKCNKDALFLDVYDGFSKCVCCGDVVHAAYTDCQLCGHIHSVVFDKFNISCNNNIMPGFCYKCRKRMKIYQCPVCKNVYSYTSSKSIDDFLDECCKSNFKDRTIPSIDSKMV